MYDILYVDDEQILLESTKTLLEQQREFSVTPVRSAAAGLQLLQSRMFDAIISDYQMEGMDGIAFLKEVRAGHGSVPFIIFTGRGREDVAIEALNNGADFYLQKGGSARPLFAELTNMLRIAIQRHHSSDIIHRNEGRLRLAQSVGKTGSWEYDPASSTFWGSEEAFRMCGIAPSPDGILDMGEIRKILVDGDRVIETFRNLARENTIVTLDFVFSPADGSDLRYIYSIAEIFRNPSGKIVKITGVIRDVTDQRNAAAEIEESTGRFRTIFENSPLAIEYFDSHRRLLDINPACCDLLGISSVEDLKGFSIMDDQNFPDEKKALLNSGQTLRFGTVINFGLARKNNLFPTTRSGSISIDVLVTPIVKEGGTVSGYLVQIIDITRQKADSDALENANKKLNLLLSVTRHDIRNQLVTLDAYLCLAEKCREDPEKCRNYLECGHGIIRSIERQIHFTRDYQNLGTKPPAWQNPARTIASAIRELSLNGVTVTTNGLEGTEILADPLLVNVFYNLVENSLRHGGDTMRTIRFLCTVTKSGLLISCDDDGTGIQTDEKEIIFSRGYGKNTGYGLFLIREILAATGITITENGIPGKGARFEILVPPGSFRCAHNP